MTYECDCKFDNRECAVTEAADRWLNRHPRIAKLAKRLFRGKYPLWTLPKCRRGKVLFDAQQYCPDRMQPRTK